MIKKQIKKKVVSGQTQVQLKILNSSIFRNTNFINYFSRKKIFCRILQSFEHGRKLLKLISVVILNHQRLTLKVTYRALYLFGLYTGYIWWLQSAYIFFIFSTEQGFLGFWYDVECVFAFSFFLFKSSKNPKMSKP